MKIYVAGSWDARTICQDIANHIMNKGHMVTSNWLWYEPAPEILSDPEALDANIKRLDVEGVRTADRLVIYTDVPSTKSGYFFEAGIAEGWNQMARVSESLPRKLVYTIGDNPRPNAFFTGFPNYKSLELFYTMFPDPPKAKSSETFVDGFQMLEPL